MKTSELEEKIRYSKRFNAKLVAENPPPAFVDFLQQCMDEKGVKKAELIKVLDINRNYGYQMLNGSRIPTRTQLIHIALFLGLDVERTQKLLNLAGRDALYVRRPEDARAVHCLEHKIRYNKACEFIWPDE